MESNPNKETGINASNVAGACQSKGRLPAAVKTTASSPAPVPSSKASSSVSPVSSRAASPTASPNKRTATPQPPNDPKHPTTKNPLSFPNQKSSVTLQGPMSTKDLILKFKRQLKADPKNKEVFRELVRKLAMVKPVAGQGRGQVIGT